MAIQTFVADTILTAAQMNALQGNDYNQTVSTKTASYTLVAADKGTKIVMNSASATTITVNTSLFSAGDTLTILNIGAGVCTVTAGTATVSTTGSLALAQNGGGTLYFTSAGVSIFQADGVTATAGGMTLLSTTTLSGASTTISSIDQTYVNLQIVITGMTNATTASTPNIQFNASSVLFTGVETYNSNGSSGTAVHTSTTLNFVTAPTRTNADNFWGITILNYGSTTAYKGVSTIMGATRNAGGEGSGTTSGYIKTNSGISSLVITNPGGTWSTGTVLVYGVK